MRAFLWLALGLGVLGTLVFGTLTWLEPGVDAADRARVAALAAEQAVPWPEDAVSRHVALRAEHATAYRVGRMGAGLLMGGVLGLLLLSVRRRAQAVRRLAWATGLVAVGLIALSPTFRMGLYGPPPPRDLAQLVGLPALVVAMSGWWLQRVQAADG